MKRNEESINQTMLLQIAPTMFADTVSDLFRYDGTKTDGRAMLTVADTGEGIAKEHVARIFEAFFTTKETGKGTGLELSVVKGIIDEHGGSIAVESELGRGTTFTIHLPLFTTSESQDIPLNCSA